MVETRKLAAILAADIVGYSRLTSADEDRTLARVRALRSDLIDPTIAVHHGRVVKRTGDGAIVEFRSVVDAVNCAREIQLAMVERNAGVSEEQRIIFRIGVHVGDVVEEADGDLMGDGVNIAARLEGVAKPGGICLSEQAYWQVKGRLDVQVEDLGPTKLKNIAEPVRTFAVSVGHGKAKRQAPKLRASARRYWLALAVGAFVVLAALALIVWQARGLLQTQARAGGTSVVVLPFELLSGDHSQDYLAEALTNGLTEAISQISGFLVIANGSARTYAGKAIDPKQIGAELDVQFVLEGTVQPSANGIRVNVQLYDTESGAQVWSERFDQERTDLVQMEDDIVARLGRELDVRLADVEAARAARVHPENLDAQNLADRCYTNIYDNPTAYADPQKRATLYAPCHDALRLDPHNQLALKLRALELLDGITRGGSHDSVGDLTQAGEMIDAALTVNVKDPGAHAVRAYWLLVNTRPQEAISEAERSLALNPNYIIADLFLCPALLNNDEPEKAIACLDKEMRLSPRDPSMSSFQWEKADALQVLGKDTEALDWTGRSLALSPNYPVVQILRIALLEDLGRDAEAREDYKRYSVSIHAQQFRSVADYKAFYSRLWPAEHARLRTALDRRLDGLRKAGMPGE